ncbi:hypothetical protein LZG04_14895 [Saccharothrix sp. S26]|uniref:hypothetical protein n=1 Tax=Saccharothrix sp. S26 TaxID=2907215 RepID=UPI001F2B83A4|nr:hypothetical protein [Saccharothrix sp. S26]MCE6996082.1 hypothetical protein [Saccharothrix sp. S26]
MVDTHAHTHSAGGPLNTVRHKPALALFMVVVLGHWAEHIAQAVQIYALGWPTPRAKGVLGLWFPWLVTSEVMHYGYALVMLVFLFALRKGFAGRSKKWWTIALGLQFWHHIEHLLLIIQASTSTNLLGRPVPTSVIQLLIPRVELHLFYNTVVFIPMVVAMVLHMRPSPRERSEMHCSCAVGASV